MFVGYNQLTSILTMDKFTVHTNNGSENGAVDSIITVKSIKLFFDVGKSMKLCYLI